VRLLAAAGGHWEIGHQIGVQGRDLVAQAVELICRFDISEDERSARLEAIEDRLGDAFPHVLDEAEGLAAGAGISRREALELSVCSDLSGKLPAWCSLLAVPGPDGPLMGKNLDTNLDMAPIQVLERIEPNGGLAYLHVTTAGAMWTDGGLNEAGLGLVNASLAAGSVNPDGIPDGILAREVLASCRDVDEAIELVSAHAVRTLGENLLVADPSGRVVAIEKLPAGQSVREGARAGACNHVLAAELEPGMDPGDAIRENSRRRMAVLDRAVQSEQRFGVAALRELLASRDGGVFQSGDDGLWTVASVVLDLAGRTLWVGETENDVFEEISLDGNGEWARMAHGEE
jgi:predicted choloylglycine hydrolase